MSNPGLWLPAHDRDTSPSTGWSRAHWIACADHLLAGAEPFVSPVRARVRFPGTQAGDVSELEGFARLFMLAALRSACTTNAGTTSADTTSAGTTHEVTPSSDRTDASELLDAREAMYSWGEALAAGTTPDHTEAWPRLGHHDQTTVEATAIVLSLHWTRSWLWDHLPTAAQQSVVDWLSDVRGKWCADNNHVLLGATIQSFLASVGASHDASAIEAALDRIDDWYLGDGWYTDGPGRRLDHYNAYTFHLYPFFIEQMLTGTAPHTPGTDPRFDIYRRRLTAFLDGYRHLFSTSGAPVLQGRSLIYRWAMVAPFWMGAIQNATRLDPGETRRLASSVLAHFADSPDMERGVLSLGWHGPARDVLQSYNKPGSPLWASKGFLGLLLPATHPTWSQTEPSPPEHRADDTRLTTVSSPAWLVHTTPSNDIVRLLNHGSDGHPRTDDKWYRRLAFSSHTSPIDLDGLRDNAVTVGHNSTHRGLVAGVARSASAASRFRIDAGGRDVTVDVATMPIGSAELRLVRLQGVLDEFVRCSGFALSDAEAPFIEVESGLARVRRADGVASEVVAVSCTSGPMLPLTAMTDEPTALGERTALPYLQFDAGTAGVVHAAYLVCLDRRQSHAKRAEASSPSTGAPAAIDELASNMRVAWHANGVMVTSSGRVQSIAWAPPLDWPADALNQGIFRAASEHDAVEEHPSGSPASPCPLEESC